MNIVFNILFNSLLISIDLYLITFYYHNTIKSSDINVSTIIKNLIFICSFITLFITNIVLKSYSITLLFLCFICYAMTFLYKIEPLRRIKLTFSFILVKIVINSIISFSFSWIFNTPLTITIVYHLVSYVCLVMLIERYILFLIISLYTKVSLNTSFKIISISIFTYFAITILFNNQSLFYFPDVGRTFVFVIFISIASLIFFDRYQVKHEKIERDLIITTQNITKEKEYLKKYNDSADEVRRMRHNMHNDLNIIYGYLNSNEFDDAMKHVCHLLGNMDKTSSIIHVGHTSIDSIIDDKIKVMNTKGITYNEEIVSVNIGNIDVNTIAILLGLALDNAIEAAEKVDGYKEVKLEIKNCKEYLVLHIVNSIIPGSQPVFHKTSKLTDPLNHGYGVKQINHIAKQYDGNAKFEVSHCSVTLKIILDMKLNEDPSL